MAGTDWAVLVLALPGGRGRAGRHARRVLNEIRAVDRRGRERGRAEPAGRPVRPAAGARASRTWPTRWPTGAWRVGALPAGRPRELPAPGDARGAACSRARAPLPEPVRVFDRARASRARAATGRCPTTPAPPGPGGYRRPFELPDAAHHRPARRLRRTCPSSRRRVLRRRRRRASTSCPGARPAGGLALGRVLHQRRRHGAAVRGRRCSSLTRHVFVAGLTGSGKTNTIMRAARAGRRARRPVPRDRAGEDRVPRAARPPAARRASCACSPPASERSRRCAEPVRGAAGHRVSEHLDLLRAAFGAAFGMWTPLPQILERCLHEVYADRGWDLRTNAQPRWRRRELADAFPTLCDLVAKVDEVVPTLGYEDRVDRRPARGARHAARLAAPRRQGGDARRRALAADRGAVRAARRPRARAAGRRGRQGVPRWRCC